jgi:hypothetical protein
MGRLLTTRRSEWLPGVAAVAAAVGVAAMLGLSLGVRHWGWYAGLASAFLLFSAIARRRAPRAAAHPDEPRDRPRLARRPPPYDLANDQSTDNQKYLM